jgi:hypothetical protein
MYLNSVSQNIRTSPWFRAGWLWILFASYARAVTIPAGTEIQVRLTSEVNSNNPSGQPVSAAVLAPVLLNGIPVVSRGTTLTGKTAGVVSAIAATEQQEEKVAQLRIDFSKIKDASGRSTAISCVVASIDNARESVDSAGLITGIKASQTYTAMMDKGIHKLADKYPDLAGILSSVKTSIVKPADPAIDFKSGVDLTVKLSKPLNWNAPPEQTSIAEVQPAAAVAQLVAEQPLRTVAAKPPVPSDLTNFLFIATEEQLRAAFQNAGWFGAEALSGESKLETARAIIEDRGYKQAPVSILFLDGRPPDLVFQRQTNTFSKRHHIRIWLRPQTFEGRPVWVGAGTHDINISFSQDSHSFSHGIDSHIDREREKIANDMEFAGAVRALTLVSRPTVPRNITNATGDALITDGKIAVVELYNHLNSQ